MARTPVCTKKRGGHFEDLEKAFCSARQAPSPEQRRAHTPPGRFGNGRRRVEVREIQVRRRRLFRGGGGRHTSPSRTVAANETREGKSCRKSFPRARTSTNDQKNVHSPLGGGEMTPRGEKMSNISWPRANRKGKKGGRGNELRIIAFPTAARTRGRLGRDPPRTKQTSEHAGAPCRIRRNCILRGSGLRCSRICSKGKKPTQQDSVYLGRSCGKNFSDRDKSKKERNRGGKLANSKLWGPARKILSPRRRVEDAR